ncbi:DNA replication/repair protein RecF [Horticoccus sp. 23ND18S-11]|uniref:DNA replication/repair protein RecF n=1 Tax=Horticoccus sp. 23ND18S-11 TaxID=3391832 RepID=UPI0039C9A2CE
MRLRKLTVRHFRNVGFAALEFSGRQHFLVGANGQGKTNLLEAVGFLTAVRSFRTTDNKLLVGHGQHCAALAYVIDHERQHETHVTIKLRHDGKELWSDQARVTKLADHLGRFPTVVFSSQDLQLVRGSPANRRRWLDLTLAAMDATYLRALQTYTRALAERNALLKSGRPGAAELGAFEQTLAPAAVELIARRDAGVRALDATLKSAYARLSAEAEPAAITYEPNFRDASAEALLARLESGRARDQQFRTTLVGPHRDDFHFTVKHTAARDFASEGQQRSLVLALRLAQAAWFQAKSGVRPVLLADDVLGELDPGRRARFWAAIDPESQVIATGTQLPEAELGTWQVFEVRDGDFSEKVPA